MLRLISAAAMRRNQLCKVGWHTSLRACSKPSPVWNVSDKFSATTTAAIVLDLVLKMHQSVDCHQQKCRFLLILQKTSGFA